jgi:protein SCO1/2
MRWAVAALAASAAIVGVCAGLLVHSSDGSATRPAARPPSFHGEASWAPGARPAPAFALRDQTGALVSLRSLRGRAVVLGFMDSKCKQACPVEGRMLAAAVDRVPVRMRPRLIVVSVDPAGDTPASAEQAMRKWQLAGRASWLLGTHAQLARVWRAYDITVLPVKGDILHSTAAYLIDAHGDERTGYLLPFVPTQMARDLARIARA